MIKVVTREREGAEKAPTRSFSKKQESKVAKDVGGKRTLNSGATPWQKSDILTEQFAIECKTKTTSSKSISIKKEWIEKLKEESLFMGKNYEALAFNFGPDEENYFIINTELFIFLLEQLSKNPL